MNEKGTVFNKYTGKDKFLVPGGQLTKEQEIRKDRQYAPVKVITAEDYNNEKRSA